MRGSHVSDVHTKYRSTRAGQILDAARALFAEAGYEATSIAGIAKIVGVADGAIYRHFASKREILHQVILGFYEPLVDSAALALRDISDPRDRLQVLVRRNLAAFAEDPLVCRLIIAEARVLDGYYESEVADLSRRYTSLAVDAVQEGIDTGLFRGDIDAASVRDVLFGAMEHMSWAALTGRSPLDIDTSTATIMAIVINGISNEKLTTDADGSSTAAKLCSQLDRLESLIDRVESGETTR